MWMCVTAACAASTTVKSSVIREKRRKRVGWTTFPTYCMSVPVYSSNKKNWFHIQPRLERLRGTPLASCPVSPADPLRPPVVLRRALSPTPGELRWAKAHSIINAQTLLLSMATPPQPPVFSPLPQWSGSSGFWSEYRISPHAVIYWSRKDSSDSHGWGGKQHLEHLHRKTESQYWEGRQQFVSARALVLFHNLLSGPTQLSSRLFEDAVLLKLSREQVQMEKGRRRKEKKKTDSFQICASSVHSESNKDQWSSVRAKTL